MKTQITLSKNDIKEIIRDFESRRGNKVIGEILFETRRQYHDPMETYFTIDTIVEYDIESQNKLPER